VSVIPISIHEPLIADVAAASPVDAVPGAGSAAGPTSSSASSQQRPGTTSFGPHQIYLVSGATYFGSDRRVLAGVGGGGGYRFYASSHIALHFEGRWFMYVGNSYAGAAGASYEFSLGPFVPLVGLQGVVCAGDRVHVISTGEPELPSALAWAAQVRLVPLRLLHSRWAVSFLHGDVGFGIDDGTRAFAFAIGLLEVGMRF
jgi:hypothetical protein